MDPFGAERWSNGRQLLGKARVPGDGVKLEFAASDVTWRKLVLYATRVPDYAVLRFQVNGHDIRRRVRRLRVWRAGCAGVDPALIVTPPPGLEAGKCPSSLDKQEENEQPVAAPFMGLSRP